MISSGKRLVDHTQAQFALGKGAHSVTTFTSFPGIGRRKSVHSQQAILT